MRQCPKCHSRNPDANKYCSQCGAVLQAEAAPAPSAGFDPEKSSRLLDLAFQLSDEGRLNDAIQVCQQAVVANPGSTSAHSLLGILYERAGQREQAIREYERALALSPDSTADRASLEQLKATRSLAAPRSRPRPSKALRYGVIAALATMAVLLLVEILAITGGPGRRGAITARTGATAQPEALPTDTLHQPGEASPVVVLPPPGEETPVDNTPNVATPAAPDVPRPAPRVAPVTVPTPREPAADDQPAARVGLPRLMPPPNLRSPDRPQPDAGSVVASARTSYFSKDYRGAIKSYQQAIAAETTPPAYLHEELAWCYHEADNVKEAKAEYRRALESYLRELARGENVSEATHGLSTCEAALRALDSQ